MESETDKLDVFERFESPGKEPRTGPLRGLWRYRIGDYRLPADIRDDELIIVAADIGHRSAVYSRRR